MTDLVMMACCCAVAVFLVIAREKRRETEKAMDEKWRIKFPALYTRIDYSYPGLVVRVVAHTQREAIEYFLKRSVFQELP